MFRAINQAIQNVVAPRARLRPNPANPLDTTRVSGAFQPANESRPWQRPPSDTPSLHGRALCTLGLANEAEAITPFTAKGEHGRRRPHDCTYDATTAEVHGTWFEHNRVYTSNGLWHFRQGICYRPREVCGGYRCPFHFYDQIHALDPGLRDDLTVTSASHKASPEFREIIDPVVAMMNEFLGSLPDGSVVWVSSVTAGYASTARDRLAPPGGFDAYLLFATGPRAVVNFSPGRPACVIYAPVYASLRAYSMWRLLPHYYGPAGRRYVCVNRAPANAPLNFLSHLDHGASAFSVPCYMYAPVNCSFLVANGGRFTNRDHFDWAFETYGDVYGTDEFVLYTERIHALYDADDLSRLLGAGYTHPDTVVPGEFTAVSVKRGTVPLARRFKRYDYQAMLAIRAVDSAVTHDRSVRRWREPSGLSRPWQGQGEVTEFTKLEWRRGRAQWVASHAPGLTTSPPRGTVVVFTFGTAGDVIPLRAISRTLASCGFTVAQVNILDGAPARDMLADCERGKSHRWLDVVHEAQLLVSSESLRNWAPYYIAGPSSVRFNLAPPSWIARPPSSGLPVMFDRVGRWLLSSWVSDVRIGAYRGARWLPRSADGLTYLVKVKNRGGNPIGYLRGSSSAPISADHASLPVVPDGNHQQILPDYAVIVCPGGAGIVQTAACCGCKVVATTSVIDRDYRRPDDAGQGVAPGADPQRVLLAMAKYDWRLWLVYVVRRPHRLPGAFAWAIGGLSAEGILNIALTCVWLYHKSGLVYAVRPSVWATFTALALGKDAGWFATLVVILLGRYVWTAIRYEVGFSPRLALRVSRSLSWSLFTDKSWPVFHAAFGFRLGLVLAVLWRAVGHVTTGAVNHLLRETLAYLSLARAGWEPEVFLALSTTWRGGIPLVHTALVAPKRQKRYEGRYVGDMGLGQEFMTGMADGHPNPGEWLIPTTLSGSMLEELPVEGGRYGALWNCQVGIHRAFSAGAGPAGLLATLAVASLLAGTVMLFAAGFTTFCVAWMVMNIPMAIGGHPISTIFPGIGRFIGNWESQLAIEGPRAQSVAVLVHEYVADMLVHFAQPGPTHALAAVPLPPGGEEFSYCVWVTSYLYATWDPVARCNVFARQWVDETAKLLARERGPGAVDAFLRLAESAAQGEALPPAAHHTVFPALPGLTRLAREAVVAGAHVVARGDAEGADSGGPRLMDRCLAGAHMLALTATPGEVEAYHNAYMSAAVMHVDGRSEPFFRAVIREFTPATCCWPGTPAALPYEAGPYYERSLSMVEAEWMAAAKSALCTYQYPVNRGADWNRDLALVVETLDIVAGLEDPYARHVAYETALGSVPYESLGFARAIRESFVACCYARGWMAVPQPLTSEEHEAASVYAAYLTRGGKQVDDATEEAAALVIRARHDPDRRSPQSLIASTLLRQLRPDLGQRSVGHASIIAALDTMRDCLSRCGIGVTLVDSLAPLIWQIANGVKAVAAQAVVALREVISVFGWEHLGRVYEVILPALHTIAQVIVAGLGRSQKSVWALLFRRVSPAITSEERLGWAIMNMENQVLSAEQQRDATIAMLNEFRPEEQAELLPAAYLRQQRLPTRPRATIAELAGAPLARAARPTDDEELHSRVQEYLQRGGVQGVDGVWYADRAHEMQSLERYSPPRQLCSPELDALAYETAQAMADEWPEAFLDARVTPLHAVARYIEKRFSPGLPFIGKFRSRAELQKTGWLGSIANAAEKCLKTGRYPGQMYHAFPKSQVVDKAKLDAGKDIRTVVAQDLLSYFVDQSVLFERNKRPPPTRAFVGIGLSLTEGGMSQIFEAMDARKDTFSLDSHQFDAWNPEVNMRLMAYLAEIGFRGTPNAAAKTSVARAHYFAMQNSHIFDLQTGEHVAKNRGGGTGQVATSHDNSWSARGFLIMLWSRSTGRRPSEFFRTNTVANTGDDVQWGTDDPIDPVSIVEDAKANFGMTVRIEGTGEVTEQTYLAKRPVPGSVYAHEYEALGATVPKFAVITDPKQFLMRRTAYRARAAGLPNQEFAIYKLKRTIGHSLLVAHQPDLYDMLAREYLEDAHSLLRLRSGEPIGLHVSRDKQGRIASVHLNVTGPVPAALVARINFLRRMGRLPSYEEIVRAWIATPVPKTVRATERKRQALIGAQALEADVRFTLRLIRSWTHDFLPDSLVKIMPETLAAPATPLFLGGNQRMELWLWRKAVGNNPDLTVSEFLSVCRESPYSAAMDPYGFMWWVEEPSNRRVAMAADEQALANHALLVTGCYVLLTTLAEMLRAMPFIGVFVEVLLLFMHDLPRVYSTANLIYWHGSGRSSATISALMPRDAYAPQKKAAVILAGLVPLQWYSWVPSTPVLRLLPAITEVYASIQVGFRGLLLRNVERGPFSGRNPWDVHLGRIIDQAGVPVIDVLTAPTASGKSTFLIGSILLNRPVSRLWLVMPRRVLRDEYGNPTVADTDVLRYKRGANLGALKVVVLTYGQFLGLLAGGLVGDSDLLVFDEFHESSPDMLLAEFHTRGRRRFFMSATPVLAFFPTLRRHYHAGIARRHDVEATYMTGSAVAMFQQLELLNKAAARRSLVIVPTIAEVDDTVAAIRKLGYEASPLTRLHRAVRPTGVIVATGIADSGLDIRPPATALVDSGEEIVQDRGYLKRQPTTMATAEQRRGRVGRLDHGVAYVHARSGQGEYPVVYPTMERYLESDPTRALFDATYGIINGLRPMAPEGFIPHPAYLAVGLDPGIHAEMSPGERDSLFALYIFGASVASNAAASRAYEMYRTMAYLPEELTHLERALGRLPQGQFLPYEGISRYWGSRPFACVHHDGSITRHASIELKGQYVRARR